jgi:ADP-dependent NAD(P)H-hydrate dehydratase
VLVGSGTFDAATTRCLLAAAVAGLDRDATLIVDAAALDVVAGEPELIRSLADRVILMPNVNEAARMCGRTPEAVAADSRTALEALIAEFGAVVALRGSDSWVSEPNARRYCNTAGHELLGVAGSGDVLAGVLVGLAARGFAPLAAALCSVYVHARAGEQLAAAGPAVGRPARELLAEVSGLVEQITAS